jgi:hypothetical protein
MTTAVSWIVNAGGDWSTAADWTGGVLPNSGDAVTISTTTVQSITHNSGSDIIDKLTVGQDLFSLGGGSLDILTSASFADGYTQTGGAQRDLDHRTREPVWRLVGGFHGVHRGRNDDLDGLHVRRRFAAHGGVGGQ